MFKLIFIFKCLLILVTSNPLQGLQSYPFIYQQNYVSNDQPVIAQMFDTYPQLLRQNSWPSYQNLPIIYQDTPKAYYDNLLLNSVPSNFIDANTRIYGQSDIDVRQCLANPRAINPNPMSNYATIPQEYVNRCVNNQRYFFVPTEMTEIPLQGSQNFVTTDVFKPGIYYNDPIQNVERTCKNNYEKRTSNHSKRVRDNVGNQNKTVKNKPSKRNYKRNKNISDNNLNEIDERYGGRQKNNLLQKLNRSNSLDTNESNMIKQKSKENNILDKKSKTNRKSKSRKPDTTDQNIIQTEAAKSHYNILSQDVDECLDINENCIDLECRRTRNNYNNYPVESFQQLPNMPIEFNSNIASYLNSFMPNQNFNTDLFAANGNYPYNFDYMNQLPKQSNVNSSGSDRRRRTRRRKKRPKSNRKSTNNTENPNKNPHIEDHCNKGVELLPNKSVQLKIKTKPMQTVPPIEDIIPQNETTKANIEVEIIPDEVNKQNIEVILEPTTIIVDDTNDENIEILPVSQEYTANIYDNDIFDDYYPDFTSDNIYLSKEDHEWNFHDRHFYNPDNKQISRDRRKYEANERRIHKTNRVVTLIQDEPVDETIDEDKKVTSTEEVKFKTPPGLDFPDFKTEMISKDKYSPKTDIKYQPTLNNMYETDKMSSFSNVKSTERNLEKNFDNAVETVYARSKVVKYGVPESQEKSNKKPNEFNHTDKPTNDGKTTIVLAKSLNYPIEYK